MKFATIVPGPRPAVGRRRRGIRLGLPDLSFPYYDVNNSTYAAIRPEKFGATRAGSIECGTKPHHRSEGATGLFAKLPIQQA